MPTTAEEMQLILAPLSEEVVLMQLPGLEAFRLLTGLQVLLRHPDLQEGDDLGEAIKVIARALQERISITPALTAICEAGWNPALDVPTESRIILPG